MPRGIQPLEQVVDLTAMPPPPPPSGRASATPSQRSTQSTGTSRRRLTHDEETSLVKLAVQFAHIRRAESHAAFYREVELEFQRLHHWHFKSVLRKLSQLESTWRAIFVKRKSGTGQELNTEQSIAIASWLEIIDDEIAKKSERRTAANEARKEREVATSWRTTLVQRQRDRDEVVTEDLPSEDEFIDVSSSEDTIMSGALPASQPLPATAAAESDEFMDLVTTPRTPTPSSRGRSRGNGVRRTPRSAGSSRSKSSSSNTMAQLFLQLEERREQREAAARREQAERDERLEERREQRELASREAFMQQMTALMQVVVSARQQPVIIGDYPAQMYSHQIEPEVNPNFVDFGRNTSYPQGARSQQPHGRFG